MYIYFVLECMYNERPISNRFVCTFTCRTKAWNGPNQFIQASDLNILVGKAYYFSAYVKVLNSVANQPGQKLQIVLRYTLQGMYDVAILRERAFLSQKQFLSIERVARLNTDVESGRWGENSPQILLTNV